MFGREATSPPEDPTVASVEAFFNRAASFREIAHRPVQSNQPLAATYALWICACVTMNESPTWLLYQEGDGMVWCRIPVKVDIADVVVAESMIGGHADPGEVLAWLEGEASDPWADGGDGNRGPVLDWFNRELRR